MWIVGVILLIALADPDHRHHRRFPDRRALARRLEGPEQATPELAELAKKVDLLEAEVDDLTRNVEDAQGRQPFLSA